MVFSVKFNCPNCGSNNFSMTLSGCMGRDSNRADCADCEWHGSIGDWDEITTLKERNKQLVEWMKDASHTLESCDEQECYCGLDKLIGK